jgi:hypothetical protein
MDAYLVSLFEEAIWINQWTPILLSSNVPGNSPQKPREKQLTFSFLGKSLFVVPIGEIHIEKQEEVNGQKCALNKTLLQPMLLCSCSLSGRSDRYKKCKKRRKGKMQRGRHGASRLGQGPSYSPLQIDDNMGHCCPSGVPSILRLLGVTKDLEEARNRESGSEKGEWWHGGSRR